MDVVVVVVGVVIEEVTISEARNLTVEVGQWSSIRRTSKRRQCWKCGQSWNSTNGWYGLGYYWSGQQWCWSEYFGNWRYSFNGDWFTTNDSVEAINGIGGVFDDAASTIRFDERVGALHHITATLFLLTLYIASGAILRRKSG